MGQVHPGTWGMPTYRSTGTTDRREPEGRLRWIRRAGIEKFRVHDLRHTCASWMVQQGVPLLEVRDVLGHSSIEMTERYAHLAPDKLRSAVGVLDRLQTGYAEREKGQGRN